MYVATCSFIHFVYPFEFNDRKFRDIQESVVKRHRNSGAGRKLPVWEKHLFPNQDFLPHIADFLNSQTNEHAMGATWRMSSGAMDSPDGIGRNERWFLSVGTRQPIEFRLGWIYLYLFASGIGFLVIEAKPSATDAAVWFDFSHFFRDGRQARIGAHLRDKPAAPHFPGVAGGIDSHPDGKGTVQDLISAVLLEISPGERWWTDAFVRGLLLPWSVLFVDQAAAGDVPDLVYRARNTFHWKQELHLTEADRRLADPNLSPYTDHQWFTFALGGAAFVACNASDNEFFRKTLPDHMRNIYFILYVLVLHQRFALSRLSYRVADCCPDSQRLTNVSEFKDIRDALLRFTARGYFAQVSQHEHHHRFYEACQRTMQVERLYREVSDEVRDLYGAMLLESNENLEKFVTTWTLRLGLLAVVAAILGINLNGYTARTDGIPWWHAALYLALGAAVSVVIQWNLNWRKRRSEARTATKSPKWTATLVNRLKTLVGKAAAGED
jgi:hypothetical protein